MRLVHPEADRNLLNSAVVAVFATNDKVWDGPQLDMGHEMFGEAFLLADEWHDRQQQHGTLATAAPEPPKPTAEVKAPSLQSLQKM